MKPWGLVFGKISPSLISPPPNEHTTAIYGSNVVYVFDLVENIPIIEHFFCLWDAYFLEYVGMGPFRIDCIT